jgi:hypothetical protein
MAGAAILARLGGDPALSEAVLEPIRARLDDQASDADHPRWLTDGRTYRAPCSV